eukprot:m.171907 g.171907  ORF g.171907 m.171907 type:complete len:226 (-) comp16509_c5_seq1:213-890(-)
MKGLLISALLCALALLIASDYPPAPHSGGKACSLNAQCGIPAANCDSLRDQCASLTGSCVNKACKCAANMYGCPNCHAKSILTRNTTDPSQFEYSTKMAMLDGSGRYVDICSVPQGGGKCSSDKDCGGLGGLCIGSQCVCPDGYMCSDCSLALNDLLYGSNCSFPSGGGSCTSSADCGQGQCLQVVPGESSYCQCFPLFACKHCSANVMDLAQGRAKCPKEFILV